jgi:hypothetical protein
MVLAISFSLQQLGESSNLQVLLFWKEHIESKLGESRDFLIVELHSFDVL